MSSNLDRLAQRWDRRRSGATSSARVAAAARVAAIPVTPLTVREQVDVACSAEVAWELVADAARRERLEPPVIDRFAVPGTPPGTVGSRHCTFVATPAGVAIGLVWELVELVPGSRIVSASRSLPFSVEQTLEVTPLTQGLCRVSAQTRGAVPPELARQSSEEGSRRMRRSLQLLKDELEERHDTSADPVRIPAPDHEPDVNDVVVAMARATVDVALPPGRVWEFLLDARNDRLDSTDPDATSFSVAGTPPGGVGELRCALVHPGNVAVAVVLVELVTVDPGRAFVARTRTVAHPAHLTMRVEASPNGTRVTKQIDFQVRAHEVEPLRTRFTQGAQQHLARVKRELETSR